MKERGPVVGRQIRVRNGNRSRRSAEFGSKRPDLRDRSFHWQKRILPLRRPVISDSELTTDLLEIDPIDALDNQRQRIRISFPCSCECFVKAVAEHVLFAVRCRLVLL